MSRLHYVNTLQKEFDSTKTYIQTSKDEKFIIDNHSIQFVRFAVNIKENKDKLPKLYWLPKLDKGHIKHTLSQTLVHAVRQTLHILTSCLTAIKKHVINTMTIY